MKLVRSWAVLKFKSYLLAAGIFILLMVALSSCNSSIPPLLQESDTPGSITVVPTPTKLISTFTPNPTITLTPIIPLIPSLGSTRTPIVLPTITPIPHFPISPENISNLAVIGNLGSKGTGYGVIWAPNGQSIIVSTGNGIGIFDSSSFKLLYEIKTDNPIENFLISEDGKSFIGLEKDFKGAIYDLNSGKVITKFSGLSEITTFCSSDKKLAYYQGWHKTLYCATRNEEKILSNPKINGNISVAFSIDGQIAALGGQDGLQLVDTLNFNHMIWNSEKNINGLFWGAAVAFSPDGKIVAASGTGKVIFFDVEKATIIHSLPISDDIQEISYSPDGNRLALIGSTGLRIIEIRKDYEIQDIGDFPGFVYGIAISPDNLYLATGSPDNTVKLWDFRTFNLIAVMDGVKIDQRDLQIRVSGSVEFSRDGKYLASGGSSGIYIWDVATRELIRKLDIEQVRSISFSPDGKTLVSESCPMTLDNGRYWIACKASSITLWDIESGMVIWQVAPGGDVKGRFYFAVGSVAFSPDGLEIASVGPGNEINLWDTTTGKLNRKLVGHFNTVQDIAFSLDGKNLVSASYDNTIKLWDLSTQKVIRTFDPAFYIDNRNTKLIYSQSGKLIFSLRSHRMTLEVWDPLSGKRLISKELSKEPTLGTLLDFKVALAISKDDEFICAGGHNGIVQCFGIPSQ
jgi:WD40 repeat protein